MFSAIADKFSSALKTLSGKGRITESNVRDAVEEIKNALIDADVNLRVVRRFVNSTLDEALGEKVLKSVNPSEQFIKIIYDRMVELLGGSGEGLNLKGADTTSVILMMGLQGSGKTTACGKLASMLRKEGRNVMLAACDLVRPAAVRQLEIIGEKAGVPVFTLPNEKNPVKTASAALSRAKHDLIDTLIVDTSGRMHLDEGMMNEIAEVAGAVKPVESLFVADAMTGQSAVEIAKAFDEKVGITGIMLTKFDSDTRGGAALSLRSVTGKSIKFIGTGEKIEDIEVFRPERIASRILGMGDVVSLVEKAQQQYDEEEAEKLRKKLSKSTYDLDDYAEQIDKFTKMGSVDKFLEMIPGASSLKAEDLHVEELKKARVIISSMTRFERANYRIIGPSRRRRIARGSGTNAQDVNKLLKNFEKTKLVMKKMTKKENMAAASKMLGL